jgi:hypothetical protein
MCASARCTDGNELSGRCYAPRVVMIRPAQLASIVSSMTKAFRSVAYIGLLMLLFTYTAAVVAVISFRDNDPVHFRNLHVAMLSLFRVRATIMSDATPSCRLNLSLA